MDGCSAEPGGLTRWINAHKKYLQSLEQPTKELTSKQQSKASNISEHHENNKTALIFGSIIIGVAALTLYKIT